MALSFSAAANNNVINAGATTSVTCTLPVAVAAGDIILAIGNCGAGSAPTSVTISDGSSDAWTDSVLGSFVGGGGFTTGRFRVGAFLTPTVGTTTVTATMSPSNGDFAEIYAWKVSGFTGTPTLDKAVQNTGTSANADSGSSGTLTASAEAAVGYVAVANFVTAAGSGWSTGGTNINDGISGGTGDIGEHRITAATTAINATASISSGDWIAMILTAYDAAGGDTLFAGGGIHFI